MTGVIGVIGVIGVTGVTGVATSISGEGSSIPGGLLFAGLFCVEPKIITKISAKVDKIKKLIKREKSFRFHFLNGILAANDGKLTNEYGRNFYFGDISFFKAEITLFLKFLLVGKALLRT